MKTLAYLDCITGIAGDMCLGALVDAGVPLDYLREQLGRLGIAEAFQLQAEPVCRNGQQATKVWVRLTSPESESGHSTSAEVAHGADPAGSAHAHAGRHLSEIEGAIAQAQLPARAAAWSLAVFRQLAIAEGAVHGIAPEQVHFHEVGAIDAIVDIVGTCLGLDWLGIDQLCCSPLPTGGGTVRAAHGLLPVPAPAVLKLWQLRQVPIYHNGINRELVTPTGAAIATTLATHFGPPPAMTLKTVGLGAGSRDLPLPNILRLWIGSGELTEAGQVTLAKFSALDQATTELTRSALSPSPPPPQPSPEPPANSAAVIQETLCVLETQVDDLNPQAIGYLFDVLFAAGAVDVFTQAIGMKKYRPGILITVLCLPEQAAACEAALFRETTTLGVRRRLQQRAILPRSHQQIQTAYGPVRVKVAWIAEGDGKRIGNVQPEYADCAKIAQQQSLPWYEVQRLAIHHWYLQHPPTAL